MAAPDMHSAACCHNTHKAAYYDSHKRLRGHAQNAHLDQQAAVGQLARNDVHGGVVQRELIAIWRGARDRHGILVLLQHQIHLERGERERRRCRLPLLQVLDVLHSRSYRCLRRTQLLPKLSRGAAFQL